MLLEFNFLKNRKTIDIGDLLSTICDEVDRAGVDPSHLKVSLDWVQYRKNFRLPIEPRRHLTADGNSNCEHEIAIDVRRLKGLDLVTALRSALANLDVADAADCGRVYLEDLCPPSQSIIWSFNRMYWQYLTSWENAFNRSFTSALPGGVSDGTNPDFWNDRLQAFADRLDELDGRGLIPEEIYILELGVGNGDQAKIWLDTFRKICEERSKDYYHRVRYLMSDYASDLLYAARETIGEHNDKVSCLSMDAADPLHSLAFLRYKVLFIHSCNLYDNLPTDEIIWRRGEAYEAKVRAYLSTEDAGRISREYGIEPAALRGAIARLLRMGPDSFDEETQGVKFWSDVWESVYLDERFVLIDDPANYRLASTSHTVRLDELLDGFTGDIRLQLSTTALRSFVNTLPLLHPSGMFQVQDIFITDLDQYRGSFRGPGKMDGSIVNWVNGRLFQIAADRMGYNVEFEPFRYREKSNTVILTTSPKS